VVTQDFDWDQYTTCCTQRRIAIRGTVTTNAKVAPSAQRIGLTNTRVRWPRLPARPLGAFASQTLQSVLWAPRWRISVLFTRVPRHNERLTLPTSAARFVPSSGCLYLMTRRRLIPIQERLLPLPGYNDLSSRSPKAPPPSLPLTAESH
jgi:hypothetical protein